MIAIPEQRQQIICASYRDFARTMFDLFWAPALNLENFRRYMRIETLRWLKKCGPAAKRLFITIHHGNFEWASLATGFVGFPTTIVTDRFKNGQVSAFSKSAAGASGYRIIPQEASMIRLLETCAPGGCSGMLVDRISAERSRDGH